MLSLIEHREDRGRRRRDVLEGVPVTMRTLAALALVLQVGCKETPRAEPPPAPPSLPSAPSYVLREPAAVEKAPSVVPPAPEPLPPLVGVHEVARAFDDNEIAARERFKGRVRLVGIARKIEFSLGHPVMRFGSSRMRTVTCRFTDAKDLLGLKKDDLYIVECRDGEPALVRGVVFSDCKYVEVANIADDYPTLIKRKKNGQYGVLGPLRVETVVD